MKQGLVMADIAIHNVRDLGQDARRTLEALLGRRLAEGEQVSVDGSGRTPGAFWRRAQNCGGASPGESQGDVEKRGSDPE